MATPFIWPQVERPLPPPEPEAIPAPPPPLGFGAAAFGASFGPELSRIAGVRVTARLVETPSFDTIAMDSTRLVIGRLPMTGGSLLFTMDRAAGSALLDRMFGGRPAAQYSPLDSLPPASGSWLAFARLVASVCQHAAQAGNCRGIGQILVPPRPMPPDDTTSQNGWPASGQGGGQGSFADPDAGPDSFSYRLDVDGVGGLLVVQPLLAAAHASPNRGQEVSAEDQAQWRQRARALTLGLDLPVTMRLAESRMSVARVAAFRPGDVIPIDPPRLVSLMVGGRCLGRLPLSDGDDARPTTDGPRNSRDKS